MRDFVSKLLAAKLEPIEVGDVPLRNSGVMEDRVGSARQRNDLAFGYPGMGGQPHTNMPPASERLMNPERPALLRTPRRRGVGGEDAWDTT